MRNEKKEKLLAAWWELSHCPHDQRAEAQARRDQMLDTLIAGKPLTRQAVLDSLWDAYKDYCQTRKRESQLGGAQSSGAGKGEA